MTDERKDPRGIGLWARCAAVGCEYVVAAYRCRVGLCGVHWGQLDGYAASMFGLESPLPREVADDHSTLDGVPVHRALILYLSWDNGGSVYIGRTLHPEALIRRLTEQNPHSPPVAILAAEPGGKARDRGLRERFAGSAYPGTFKGHLIQGHDALSRHLEAVRAKHPRWASYVDAMARARARRRSEVDRPQGRDQVEALPAVECPGHPPTDHCTLECL